MAKPQNIVFVDISFSGRQFKIPVELSYKERLEKGKIVSLFLIVLRTTCKS